MANKQLGNPLGTQQVGGPGDGTFVERLKPQLRSVEAAPVAADWDNGVNCVRTSSATQAMIGTKSLRLAAASAADMSANTPIASSAFPVTPGGIYRFSAYVISAVSRVCVAKIQWYKQDGTASATASNAGTGVASSTTVFTNVFVQATAPADAAFAALVVFVTAPANTELHYFDNMSFVSVDDDNIHVNPDLLSIQALRNRLTAIDSTGYSIANLDAMTKNDMIYAVRMHDSKQNITTAVAPV